MASYRNVYLMLFSKFKLWVDWIRLLRKLGTGSLPLVGNKYKVKAIYLMSSCSRRKMNSSLLMLLSYRLFSLLLMPSSLMRMDLYRPFRNFITVGSS